MLDQQKAERRKILIEGKKQHYNNILKKIISKEKIRNITKIEILGITEGNEKTFILYKAKIEGKEEIYELRIKNQEKAYKIEKPESKNYIEASNGFWLFKEDMED